MLKNITFISKFLLNQVFLAYIKIKDLIKLINVVKFKTKKIFNIISYIV